VLGPWPAAAHLGAAPRAAQGAAVAINFSFKMDLLELGPGAGSGVSLTVAWSHGRGRLAVKSLFQVETKVQSARLQNNVPLSTE
jgi:hypothetical protein